MRKMINVPYEDMPREIEALLGEIEQLEEENQKLKQRIEYLERSNSRREEEIISLKDELIESGKNEIN